MDKKLVAIGAALAALIVFWAVQSRNDSTRAAVEEAEGPSSSNMGAAMETFAAALEESQQLLRAERALECARKLYHAFPPFESYLQSRGYEEVEPGLTLNAWFETKKSAFSTVLGQVYPKLVSKLKSGDLAWRDMDAFMREMPFPFIHDLRRTYENQDRPEIAHARASQASSWCYLSVLSVSGNGENYEHMVRDALQAHWNAQPGLKLIFDAPHGREETRAAGTVIDVRIEENFADYAFEGDAKRGGGRVPESAAVRFSARGKSRLKTNWESLQPIIVTNEAPEALRFKFEHERQTADFSDLADRQRKALETKLAAALSSIPRFELLSALP